MLPSKNRNKKTAGSKEEKSHGLVVSRRTFLGVSAGVGAALAASRFLKPGISLASDIDLDKPPYGVVTEKWIATSCLNCPTRCATRVRVVNDKAVRIAGNPLSKVSEGENCPRSHIGLQVLYDPDRVKSPLKRTNTKKGKGIDPGWVSISWDQALEEISKRLNSLRTKEQAHKLLFFRGLNTISNEDLINRLASSYGTPNVVLEEGLENEADKAGEWMADGHYTQSAYDLEHTNYILAFGASITESQKPLARNLRMWGKIRRERPNRAKVVVIDPRYSVTAAKADQWLPINPGTDGALALAVANVIISEGLYDFDFVKNWTAGFDKYKDLVLSGYAPENVSEMTGISADLIRDIAREFAQTKPAIAWRGRGATCWPDGSHASYAIFCLNALVGSIDVPGGVTYQEYPAYRDMPSVVEDSVAKAGKSQPRLDLSKTSKFPTANVVTNQVADSILDGEPYPIEVAIGFNSNLNMSAPGTGRWDEAMSKVPYYVHISPSIMEMGEYADIILPACTFLEEWAYDHCPPGSGFAEAKIKQPVVRPVDNSRPIGDIIFELARRVGAGVAQSFIGIGDDAEGFVKYRTATLMPWDEFRDKGVWVGPAYQYQKYDEIFNTPSKKFEFYSGNMEAAIKEAGSEASGSLASTPHYEDAQFLGDKLEYPLKLVTYHPLLDVESGNQNYPWAQEILMVMHGQGWSNFVEINRETARVLGIRDMDVIWVESPFSKIKARARVFEGIHPDVVAVASGEGHYACGRWANGIGVNPNDIIGVDYDYISGQSSFFNTRVKVYKA
jgi:anaerobic selenocysteine-containing dehydrogenase